jgi:phage shock protein E
MTHLLVALALVVTLPVACSSPSRVAPVALAPGTIVLDVRTQEEWNAGHAEGSHLLPLPQLSQRLADVDKWTGGDKNRAIVVVCRSGNRAGQAKKMLEAAGYTHVENGGAWESLLPHD